MEIIWGSIIEVIKGHTRTLDCGSSTVGLENCVIPQPLNSRRCKCTVEVTSLPSKRRSILLSLSLRVQGPK